jgi:hypothetical protein
MLYTRSKAKCRYLMTWMSKWKLITLTKFSSMTKSPISSVISVRWLWASWSVRNSWTLKSVAGRLHSLLQLRFRWVNLTRHPNSAGTLSRLLLCIWVQYTCTSDRSPPQLCIYCHYSFIITQHISYFQIILQSEINYSLICTIQNWNFLQATATIVHPQKHQISWLYIILQGFDMALIQVSYSGEKNINDKYPKTRSQASDWEDGRTNVYGS